MRKSIIFAAVLVAAAVSCRKEMMQAPDQSGNFTIKATREACANTDTKASIDADGKFTWSSGDAIGIWTGSKFEEMTTTDDKAATATFSGALEGTPSDFAVFPYSLNASYSDGAVKVTLPASYEWKEDQVCPAMYAQYANTLSFKHLGGLVMVTLKNVPADAAKFVFNTDKDITGEYTMLTTEEIVSKGETANNKVTYTFTLTEARDMVFYVPVPVGEYKFGFTLYDAAGKQILDKQGTTTNAVARKVLKQMPALTCTTVSIPADYYGKFCLPDTNDDVVVNVAGSCTSGTVELVYAAGGAAPANVTINSDATVESLIINLPDSHVNLAGGNYVTVTSNTSLNALVLDKDVTISSKLNVAGGSAEIAGTVQEVEIQESVAADAKIVFAPNADVTVVNTKSPAQIVITPGTVSDAIYVNKPESEDYLATYSAPIVELQDGASVNISGDAATIESTTETSASGEQQYSEITVKSGNEKGLRYAVENCESVKLTTDIEVSSAIEIDGTLALDLAGKAIKASSGMTADAVIIVRRGGELTIKGNGTVTTNGEAGVYAAIKLSREGKDATKQAKLTINNGTFTGTNYAITGDAATTDDNVESSEITINDGTFSATKEGDNLAIFHPQYGTLNINGGKFTGYLSAVEIKAGYLIIDTNDGTFESTANTSSYNSGAVDVPAIKGAAIAISNGVAGKSADVSIYGGAFLGGDAVYDIGNDSDLNIDGGMFYGIVHSDKNESFIRGGTFYYFHPNSEGNYVASECTVEGEEPGPWIVQ